MCNIFTHRFNSVAVYVMTAYCPQHSTNGTAASVSVDSLFAYNVSIEPLLVNQTVGTVTIDFDDGNPLIDIAINEAGSIAWVQANCSYSTAAAHNVKVTFTRTNDGYGLVAPFPIQSYFGFVFYCSFFCHIYLIKHFN